ncbi:PAS domain S-box-containing protein/diguanylate cyclase (GGDEF) domain-containing protein [Noviherbaspirillum humi]|uniref:PAS domain S-box-containing protein/diguanylate cyclase (GGDEF) domain-containing protein n=1 Tax=Noviherbaspirillum humi TaxID=1688639 RepID=A0A239J537_9BURK|nr:EAL domain-containing protein [Noviherbaspirillum humi]SNT00792.1 PAS domain S-box-containing protein/diguanylate cyclase (GGDEF) domain-containing protein [Noviherbaspirillum humi]
MSLISRDRPHARIGAPAGRAGVRPVLALALHCVALGAIYFLAAVASLHFSISPTLSSPLWLPAVLATWACLRWGRHLAPGVFLGALSFYLTLQLGWQLAVVMAAGNVLELWLAVTLMRRRMWEGAGGESLRLFANLAIAAVAGTVAATICNAALMLSGRLPPEEAVFSWVIWWLGNMVGLLLAAPALSRGRPPAGFGGSRHIGLELSSLCLLLALTLEAAFGERFGKLPLAFLTGPFIIWAAYRFNAGTVTAISVWICAVAAWHTARGEGPFVHADRHVSLLLIVSYGIVISIVNLALVSLVARHRRDLERLSVERDLLEGRVAERTAELTRDIDQRKQVEQKLAQSEGQLREAQYLAQLGSWNWNLVTGEISWSDELYRIYGVDPASFELTTENCRALLHPDDLPQLIRASATSRDSGEPFHLEHRIIQPSGAVKWVASRGFVVLGDAGKAVRLFGTTQDITEARRAETSLREAEGKYRLLVELSPDAIVMHQDGVIGFANPAALALFGAERPEQVVGKPVFDFIDPGFHELERQRLQTLAHGIEVPRIEQKARRLNGATVDVDVHARSFMHQGRRSVMTILRDITELKRATEQMAYLAHFDSLTGLPNRMLFRQRLEHALNLSQRPGKSVEILFLDLDRFKNINDTLGHAVGDRVLKETASRLQAIMRESDTVARLGGDEFVVLVENIDEPLRGAVIADKILAAFIPPFIAESGPLSIRTSIGISIFPNDGADADTLLKKADIAMYRAKESGRNAYRYYSEEMNLHTTERLALEYALGQALRNGQLWLEYQPKVDLLSGRITGMEALLRWRHPQLGDIPAQKFINLAEETGQIEAIGQWALRTACRQNKLWQETTEDRLLVAVNLSPRQLNNDRLTDDIRAILQETGLEARYLELEITEGAVMSNPEKAIIVLQALRDMGVSVAIDDFGIGYSSLAYLKQFPIRAVKIDRSFVQGVPQNPGDSAITRAIISLAHSLECSVIAEGAETEQQVDFLRDHDCDSIQGYYFSKPLSAEEFGALVAIHNAPAREARQRGMLH